MMLWECKPMVNLMMWIQLKALTPLDDGRSQSSISSLKLNQIHHFDWWKPFLFPIKLPSLQVHHHFLGEIFLKFSFLVMTSDDSPFFSLFSVFSKVPLECVGSLPARCDCDGDAFLALPRFTHGVLRRDAGKLPEDHPRPTGHWSLVIHVNPWFFNYHLVMTNIAI